MKLPTVEEYLADADIKVDASSIQEVLDAAITEGFGQVLSLLATVFLDNEENFAMSAELSADLVVLTPAKAWSEMAIQSRRY